MEQQMSIYSSEELNAKKCNSCLQFKEISCFHKHKKHKDGLNPMCKTCRKEKYIEAKSRGWKKNKQNCRTKMLANARNRAKEKKIPFNLTIEDIIIPNVCPILGIKISEINNQAKDDSPTLDRINPNPKIGYVRGNVQVISHRANLLKNNATLEELDTITRWMKRNI